MANTTIANTALSYSGSWARFQSVAIWSEDRGDSAILTFNGTGITAYGFQTYDVVDGNAKSTFTIDDGIPSFVQTSDDTWCVLCPQQLDQSPGVLYSSPTLPHGTHTLNVTVGESDGWIGLDHFVVTTLQASASPLPPGPKPSSSPTGSTRSTEPSSSASSSGPTTGYPPAIPTGSEGKRPWISEPASIASVVIGATVAMLCLAALGWYVTRRRRRNKAKESGVKPYMSSASTGTSADEAGVEAGAYAIPVFVSTLPTTGAPTRSEGGVAERARDLKRASPTLEPRWSRSAEEHQEYYAEPRNNEDDGTGEEGMLASTRPLAEPRMAGTGEQDWADGESVSSSIPPPYTA